jgi:hypothetical protein
LSCLVAKFEEVRLGLPFPPDFTYDQVIPATIRPGETAVLSRRLYGCVGDDSTYEVTGMAGALARKGVARVRAETGIRVKTAQTIVSGSAGGTVAQTVTVTPLSGFLGPGSLAVNGLPAGVTAVLGQTEFTLGASSTTTTLTITVPAGFAAGSYAYSIDATSAEGIQASGQSLIVTQ